MLHPTLQLLSSPAAYRDDRPAQVELRETHISWVFLTQTHAYKLKKPVTFDFLDFGSPELRRRACEDELRLNRRLAPDIYLRVAPVTKDANGRLELDGGGEPVDWVVVMRRLPDDRSLSAMIGADRLSDRDVRTVAEWLSGFYAELPPVSIGGEEYRGQLDRHVRANRQTLLRGEGRCDEDMVRRVHSAQLRYLHAFPHVLDRRASAGRIVEGHGDLRPEHVYLAPAPVAIDCIEFSPELRRLDVLDELCFLAMECACLDAEAAGERIVELCLKALDDDPPESLQAFYMAYRACVRAKVELLRSQQSMSASEGDRTDEVAKYLELADRVCRRFGPPQLLVVRGLSGVGKSTVARALAELLGVEHLQTDAIRRELFGEPSDAEGHNVGIYSAANRRRVYRAMFDRAGQALRRGISVVLDGTFLTRDLQLGATRLADETGARLLLVNCSCAPETAAERIANRRRTGQPLSEATAQTHRRQLVEQQQPPQSLPQCDVATEDDIWLTTRKILDHVRRLQSSERASHVG